MLTSITADIVRTIAAALVAIYSLRVAKRDNLPSVLRATASIWMLWAGVFWLAMTWQDPLMFPPAKFGLDAWKLDALARVQSVLDSLPVVLGLAALNLWITEWLRRANVRAVAAKPTLTNQT